MSESDNAAPMFGVLVFAVLLLIYNLALWGLIHLLETFGAISWTLEWHETAIIVLIVMIWRMIDRSVFRRTE